MDDSFSTCVVVYARFPHVVFLLLRDIFFVGIILYFVAASFLVFVRSCFFVTVAQHLQWASVACLDALFFSAVFRPVCRIFV